MSDTCARCGHPEHLHHIALLSGKTVLLCPDFSTFTPASLPTPEQGVPGQQQLKSRETSE